MADGDFRIGLNGAFKYGLASDLGVSQAATEATNVDNVQLAISMVEASFTKRGVEWEDSRPVIKQGTLTFKVAEVEDSAGTALLAQLETAVFANPPTKLSLWPTTSGSGKGLDAPYYITGFDRSEDNPDIVAYNVTAKPSNEVAAHPPVWQ